MSLQMTPQGVILPVKVTPKARKTQILGWENGYLKVHVSAPPDKGAANSLLLRTLADALDLPKSALILLSGHTSRQKTVLIERLTLEQISARLIP
jgi:uncharacterized protein